MSDSPSPSRSARARLALIAGIILLLHLAGWLLYRTAASDPHVPAAFLGAGALAYVLGVRHAFDADHIAAIDDTTRLMIQRGKHPYGVGFFFAMGHSSVVLVMAVLVAVVANTTAASGFAHLQEIGGTVSGLVALSFLTLVAVLNALALAGVVRCWRDLRAGRLDEEEVERQLARRGLLNRLLRGRARGLVRSSWHMFPVGALMGLGLETASEITLLSLSASSASNGASWAAILALPLLFAAGMSLFDTLDSLLMTRAYSWSARNPARKLFYNMATTWATVLVAGVIATVYLAGFLADDLGVAFLAPYASLGDHFEALGYATVGGFAAIWIIATLAWRFGRFDREQPRAAVAHSGTP
ncbi:HoxN/HupN/NixA family nickel/cobalt transporter [Streptomyces sp. NPDC059255]|uniref:HoxN/HupN/NixA family nickel/cobalt transporter n=1 Tax=Streptomyces sp. NPDC059255 TaxID=3346793 RepID=UPI0036B199F2